MRSLDAGGQHTPLPSVPHCSTAFVGENRLARYMQNGLARMFDALQSEASLFSRRRQDKCPRDHEPIPLGDASCGMRICADTMDTTTREQFALSY